MQNEPVIDKKLSELPKQIVAIDKAILLCAVAHKSGYLVALSRNIETLDRNREPTKGKSSNFVTLLDDADIEKYLFQMGITCGIMKSWERKLGHVRHFVSYYDKMPLVTIILDNDYFVLLGLGSVKQNSIDHIMSQKVIPSLAKILVR